MRFLFLVCLGGSTLGLVIASGCASDGSNPGKNSDGGSPGVDSGLVVKSDSGDVRVPGTQDICSKDGWCWEHPSPQGQDVRGVWGSSATDVWEVGEAGTILHFDGVSWTRVPSGTKVDLQAVSGSSATDVWAVGYDDAWNGEILHYDGRAWSAQKFEQTRFTRVWSARPGEAWASGIEGSGSQGPVLLRFDGTKWTSATTGFQDSDRRIDSLWGSAGDDLYAVTWRVLHWDGHTWSPVAGLPNGGDVTMGSVWGTGKKDVWVGGGRNRAPVIFHFDGAVWRETPSAFESGASLVHMLWGSGANDVWAAASLRPGSPLSHWDGAKWTAAGAMEPIIVDAAWSASPGKSWAVGRALASIYGGDRTGISLAWDGSKWSTKYVTSEWIHGIWSSDRLWAVGGYYILNKTGDTWNARWTYAWQAHIQGIWGSSPNDLWAIGNDDIIGGSPFIMKYDGTAWNHEQHQLALRGWGDLHAIWGTAANDVWISGEHVLAHWNGTTWTKDLIANTVILDQLWGSSATDIWAAGRTDDPSNPSPRAFHWNGTAWSPASVDGGAIWGSAANDVWMLNTTKLQHWDGSAWTSVPNPAGAKTIHAAWGNGPRNIWATGDDGLILHYDGAAWTAQDSGTTHSLNAVRGHGNQVFVGGRKGTLLRHPL
ncbi:hypothetical protein [Pendulispora albinea]|uniref:Uncharacterized protein n=1 Tax=Pendulispora albinea TaxID=2741071 RepID=A0ABZ2LP20_9BACT